MDTNYEPTRIHPTDWLENKRWQKEMDLHKRIGELEGALQAVLHWDVPQELKAKIKQVLGE